MPYLAYSMYVQMRKIRFLFLSCNTISGCWMRHTVGMMTICFLGCFFLEGYTKMHNLLFPLAGSPQTLITDVYITKLKILNNKKTPVFADVRVGLEWRNCTWVMNLSRRHSSLLLRLLTWRETIFRRTPACLREGDKHQKALGTSH